MIFNRSLLGVALVALGINSSFIPSARAGSHTWSGAINGNWSVAGNWSAGGAPVSGETDVRLTFPTGAARLNTTNNIGALTVTTLTISGDDYRLRGNFTLTFAGAGGLNVLVGGTNNSLASPLLLTGDVGFTVSTGNALNLEGQINGTGGLTKFGQGTLTLAPVFDNGFGGGVTVRDGALELFSQGLNSSVVIPGPLTIGASNSAALTFVRLRRDNQIADAAAVIVHTNATLDLNDFDDSIGALTMIDGSVSTGTGVLGLNGDFAGSLIPVINGRLGLNGAARTFDISNGFTTVNARIVDGAGGSGGLLKLGAGRLLLTVSNAFSGPVNVNQGVLQIAHANALGSTSAGTIVNDGGTLSVLGGLTISGESLGLGGAGHGGQGALRAGGNGSTWAGPMGLGVDAVVTVGNPNDLFTISAGVSGFGKLIKQGQGTLVFSGSQANTCLGGAQVDAGTLNLQKLPGVNAVVNRLVIGGTNDAPGSAVVQVFSDDQIADSTAVFVDRTGRLDLGVKSDTIGSLTLRGGTASSSLGTLTLGGNVTNLAATWNGTNVGAFIHGKLSLGNATRTFSSGDCPGLEIDATISGTAPGAGITLTGGGCLYLGGNNTYQGITTVELGVLVVSSDTALGAATSGTVLQLSSVLVLHGDLNVVGEPLTLAGPGFLTGALNSFATNSWSGPVTVASNTVIGVFDDDLHVRPGALFLCGSLSGGGALRKSGSAPLVLCGTNSNSLTGALTVAERGLLLSKTNAVAIAGPLIVGTTNSYTKTELVRNLAPNQIAPSAVVSVLPSGVLDLNGFNDSVGPLYLRAGDVATGAGRLTLSGEVVVDDFRQGQTSYGSTIGGRVALGGAEQLIRTTNSAVVDIRASLIDGGGASGLVVTGDGLVLLDGTNSFNGPVVVNHGELHIATSKALGTSFFGTTVSNDATLVLIGDNLEIAGEALTLSGGSGFGARLWNYGTNSVWSGPVTLEGNNWIDSVPADGSLELRSPIGGPGGFSAVQEGRIVLSGSSANTYAGETYLSRATLLLSKTNATAIAGPLTLDYSTGQHGTARLLRPDQIADGARVQLHSGNAAGEQSRFDLDGSSDVIGSLAGDGLVTLGDGRLTVGADDSDAFFSGEFNGTGGATNLIKTGGGVLTLAGVGNYTGKTVVNGGQLLVNGPFGSSPFHVNSGATLGGQGIVGAISAAGGNVAPGGNPATPAYGILRSSGINLGPGTLFKCELGGVQPGTSCDQLDMNGALVLNNAALALSEHFSGAVGDQFTLIAVGSGGVAMGTFAGMPEGAMFSIAPGRTFQITYHGGDGNDVVVTQLTVPQPAHITGIGKSPLGPMQVNAVGTPGLGYDVYATTNLVGTNWLHVGSVTADGSGLLQFLDNDSLVLPMRFYRFALP